MLKITIPLILIALWAGNNDYEAITGLCIAAILVVVVRSVPDDDLLP